MKKMNLLVLLVFVILSGFVLAEDNKTMIVTELQKLSDAKATDYAIFKDAANGKYIEFVGYGDGALLFDMPKSEMDEKHFATAAKVLAELGYKDILLEFDRENEKQHKSLHDISYEIDFGPGEFEKAADVVIKLFIEVFESKPDFQLTFVEKHLNVPAGETAAPAK